MERIKIEYIIIIVFMTLSGLVKAQDVDDIIAKHIKAHGGEKMWEAIESIHIEGRFTAFSEENTFDAVKTQASFNFISFAKENAENESFIQRQRMRYFHLRAWAR